METRFASLNAHKILRRKKVLQISYETELQAELHFLLHYFVYLTTFSARIQDGWWQQDTCFAWSRIKIYCWSWAFCSCIILTLFLYYSWKNRTVMALRLSFCLHFQFILLSILKYNSRYRMAIIYFIHTYFSTFCRINCIKLIQVAIDILVTCNHILARTQWQIIMLTTLSV